MALPEDVLDEPASHDREDDKRAPQGARFDLQHYAVNTEAALTAPALRYMSLLIMSLARSIWLSLPPRMTSSSNSSAPSLSPIS